MLCRRYDYPYYKHSFQDSFLTFNIWDNELSISFDFRCEEQSKLFEALPKEIKGYKQKWTGKMVNLKNLYFTLTDFIKVEYPEIRKQELFKTDRSKDNDGDDFYVYNYKVHLADGSILLFSNQSKNEPLNMNWIYPTYINTRAFLRYLKGINI